MYNPEKERKKAIITNVDTKICMCAPVIVFFLAKENKVYILPYVFKTFNTVDWATKILTKNKLSNSKRKLILENFTFRVVLQSCFLFEDMHA